MTTFVTEKPPIVNFYAFQPLKDTQGYWYNTIIIALMKLNLIPSDRRDLVFGAALAGILLSERQCTCIEEFWFGLEHLEPSDWPIINLVKKALQLPPSGTLLDKKYRESVEIHFDGSKECMYISFGYQIALSLESPFFKKFFQTQQPYLLKDCDKNTFSHMLKAVSSNKRVDLKQASMLLPLAIKFQLKKLEQKFINETIRTLNDLFAETKTDKKTHLDKVVRFLRVLETELGWETLPDEIIKNLRNHASKYKLNTEACFYIQNFAALLSKDPAERPQLRNFLSACLYNYRSMCSAMWMIIKQLNPSELALNGPDVYEFEDILKISALKKLVIFEYKYINFSTANSDSVDSDSDDDEGISANASITEFSITIDALSFLPLNMRTLVNLFPNVQMFELSNSRHPKEDHPLLLLNTKDYVNSFIEWNELQTIKFKDMRVNCYSLLNVDMCNHPNLKEIVFTNCELDDSSFQELTNKLPKIKITKN